MPFRHRHTGLIEHYRDRLPLSDDARVISLGEGNTPLIRLNHLPRDLGRRVDLYVKCEGLNPAGSFKDRGMTAAVIQAVDEGSQAIGLPQGGRIGQDETRIPALAEPPRAP